MLFDGPEFLPSLEQARTYLDALRRYLPRAARRTAADVLRDFFGRPLSPETLHLQGIHHVAVYLGDYHEAQEVAAWIHFLQATDSVQSIRFGPSYIAPKHYATPGYWINCTIDGIKAELFSLCHEGSWQNRLLAEKQLRMSHYALAVDDASRVRPLLEYLAHYQDVEVLAYSPCDELGHVYGHLRHVPSGRVLELVCGT